MSPRPALSVLDLAPIAEGSDSRRALRQTVELARLTEELGFRRFWLAEHHGMPSIASSSPEVLIAHVAAHTERIRVGAGGIMLPNHAPIRIAEAFRTLEALHPGRIDLGIGRAPGTDRVTSSALRPFNAEQFPAQMTEMLSMVRRDFPEDHPFHRVRVVPDDVPLPPIWLLGSSGASAAFAGQLGLGYGFASHFSPTSPLPAIRAYRENFQPSEWFPKPHLVLALSVICAETDEEAAYLSTSMELNWVRLQRNEFGPIPDPEFASTYEHDPLARTIIRNYRAMVITGSQARVRDEIRRVAAETGADEIMISTTTFSHEARLRSYELVVEGLGG